MRVGDVPRLLELEAASFPAFPPDRRWRPEQLEAHLRVFPAGQWVAEARGAILGSCTNLRLRLEDALCPHRWTEITGHGMLTTHRPDGDTLYGTEIMVHPDARRQGIAKRLYQTRKDYVIKQGLRGFVSGGRIPGYERFADHMTAQEYVARVIAGLVEDRVLTPQLKAGMRVVGVLDNYLTDPRSRNHATLLLWLPAWLPPPKPEELDEVGRE
jgi:ribosomal protein S18 acetylase RimI-like enzyme